MFKRNKSKANYFGGEAAYARSLRNLAEIDNADEYSDVEEEYDAPFSESRFKETADSGGVILNNNRRGDLIRTRGRGNWRASMTVMMDVNATNALLEAEERSNAVGNLNMERDSLTGENIDPALNNKISSRRKSLSEINKITNKLSQCDKTSLPELMAAAEADIAAHNAKALRPGETENDRRYRYDRQQARDGEIKELKSQASHILASAKNQSRSRMDLSDWEKALELHAQVSSDQHSEQSIDSMALLEMLIEGCSDVSTKDILLFTFLRFPTERNKANIFSLYCYTLFLHLGNSSNEFFGGCS